MRVIRLLALVVVLALLRIAEASAFGYYKTVTIDHTQVGGSTLTDYPVTISVTDVDLKTIGNGGYVTSSSGYDIRPYSDSGLSSALTFELVTYTAATGKVELHVKVASVSSAVDTVFYLAFGDAGVTTDGSNVATWDTDFKAIYHQKDGATLALSDSTTNANTLTNTNSVGATTGQLDGGSGPYVIASSQGLWKSGVPTAGTSNYLLSAWVKMSATAGETVIVSNGDQNTGYSIEVESGNWKFLNNGIARVDSTVAADTNTHYLALRNSGGTSQMYVDGAAAGSSSGAGVNTPATMFTIGVQGDNTSPTFLRQSAAIFIDEVRISAVARTAGWITAEWNNQKASSTFLAYGSRTAVGGAAGAPTLGLLGIGK